MKLLQDALKFYNFKKIALHECVMGCVNYSCILNYILVIDEDENSCELVVIRGFFMLKKTFKYET
jgi:hypothetical protein